MPFVFGHWFGFVLHTFMQWVFEAQTRVTCSENFVWSSIFSRFELHVVVWVETQQMAVHNIDYLCCTLLFPAVIVQSPWDYRAGHPAAPWLRVQQSRRLLQSSILWSVTFALWIKTAESAKENAPDISSLITGRRLKAAYLLTDCSFWQKPTPG